MEYHESNIDPKLIAALIEAVKKPIDIKDINETTDIVNEIGMDSLSLMSLTIKLESLYSIDVASNIHILMKVVTVADLQKYVNDLT